ncbi:MAG: HTH domain-containing protein [Firmicutes bacterium]|nr:HTH domain-containing protein [Bacillota bacterium]
MELHEIKSESYQKLLEVMALHRDFRNPISRKDLEVCLGISDRIIRDMIKKARKRGIPILSDSSNYGYFLSYRDADISRFLNREILSKIKDLSETFQALSVHIKPIDPNQITIDEVVNR